MDVCTMTVHDNAKLGELHAGYAKRRGVEMRWEEGGGRRCDGEGFGSDLGRFIYAKTD